MPSPLTFVKTQDRRFYNNYTPVPDPFEGRIAEYNNRAPVISAPTPQSGGANKVSVPPFPNRIDAKPFGSHFGKDNIRTSPMYNPRKDNRQSQSQVTDPIKTPPMRGHLMQGKLNSDDGKTIQQTSEYIGTFRRPNYNPPILH